MKVLKLCFKLILLIIIFHMFILNSYSQDLKLLISYAESYQFDKLREAVEKLTGKQKETAAALYLKALIEKDGEKALAIYNKIIESDSESITAEKSLWRIAQYYYIKGLYMKSSALLRRIINNFPGTLSARKAKEQLNIINEVYGKKEKPSIKPFEEESKFVIQLGAFSNKKNAEKRVKFLNKNGYGDAKVSTKVIGKRLLYLVWLGNFDNESSARRSAELMEKKLRIDYRIVKVNRK